MARPFFVNNVTQDEALGGTVVDRSLRFAREDTHYLSKTFGSGGNQKKWTFSCWIKRGALGGDNYGGGEMRIFGSNTNASHIYLQSGEVLTWDISDGSGTDASLVTNRMFRDNTNWFHIVCALDTDESTANNRMRMYINGIEETAFNTRNNVSSGKGDNRMNANNLHTLGYRTSAQGSAGMQFDGYLTEINFIDGQQYDPSYFGYFESQTGIWRPKKYEGSYGTTGFYLDFNNKESTTTLGYDKSGNGNHWTTHNIEVNDSVPDSPTNNWAVWRIAGRPLNSACDFKQGMLLCETGTSGGGGSLQRVPISSYVVNSGKWYCETWNINTYSMATIAPVQTMRDQDSDHNRKIMIFSSNGQFYDYRNASSDSSPSTYAASWTNGDVIGMLIDMDQATPVAYFSKNGQWTNGSGSWNQSNPYTSGGGIAMTGDMLTVSDNDQAFLGYVGFCFSSAGGGTDAQWITNFGQDSTFAGRTTAGVYSDDIGLGEFKYPVPEGALALCNNNVARVNKRDGTTAITNPKRHVDCVVYTGAGSGTQDITSLEFQPDFVWIKGRSSGWNVLVDSVRGVGKILASNETAVENNSSDSQTAFQAFLPNGFRVGHNASWYVNGGSGSSSQSQVAWCWKAGGAAVSNSDGTITSQVSANQEAGFSIVTYTGTGADASVGHGLGTKPQVLWVKSRDNTDSWKVWFKGVTTDDSYSWQLDTHGANYSGSDKWYNSPNGNDTTTTTFGVSNDNATNRSSAGFVAYCFSARKGYSAFGTYRGNGSNNGQFVRTGFKPRILIVKKYSGTDNWQIWDTERDPHNLMHYRISPSEGAAESTSISSSTSQLEIYGDGFQWRGSSNDTNGDGDKYIYMVWAEETQNTAYFTQALAR